MIMSPKQIEIGSNGGRERDKNSNSQRRWEGYCMGILDWSLKIFGCLWIWHPKKKNRGVVKLGRFVRRCDLEIQCNFPIKIKLFPFSFLFQDLAPEGFGFQSENWWMVFYISVALGCLFYLSFLSFVVKVALPQNLVMFLSP